MAPSESGASKQSAWERLQDRFLQNGEDGASYDRPRHRGVVITVCILLSAIFWFVFTMQETYTVAMELPTRVVNLPQDQALAELPPSEVRAMVRGKGFSLLNLKYNPPAVPLNASSQEVNLAEAVPDFPKNLQVESFIPSRVELQKDRRITRTVPVRLRGDISTPSTHDLLEEPDVEPDSVEVSGAASLVKGLDYWPTRPLNVEGLKDSLSVRVALADTLQGLVQHDVETVTVEAVSRQFTEGSRVVDVWVTGAPSDQQMVTLEPQSVKVRYKVLFDEYEAAQRAEDFFATVPYGEIRADTTGRVDPTVHLPENLTIRDMEVIPSTLRYYNVLN